MPMNDYYHTLLNEKIGGFDLFARYLASDKLPPGYELVESAYNTSASVLVNTAIKPNVRRVELEVKVKAVSGSWYVFQARTGAGDPIYGISGSGTGNTITGVFPGNKTLTSAITRTNGHVYLVKYVADNGNGTLTVTDETAGTTDVKTTTYTYSSYNAALCLFGNTSGDRIAKNTAIYYATMRKSGELVMNYAPCVHENTVGFWDYVTKSFITPTSGTLAAG